MLFILLTTTGSASLFTFLIGTTLNKTKKLNHTLLLTTIPFILLPFFIPTNYYLILTCSTITLILGYIIGHQIKTKKFLFLLAFPTILILYYAIYSWSIQIWYYASIFTTTTIIASLLIHQLKIKYKKILPIILTILLITLFFTGYYPGHMTSNQEKYELIPIIENLTEKNAKIGSFNSGLYAYFSERTIINLDGVTNNNAYYAIRDSTLKVYIEQNTNYLVDYDDSFESFAVHSKEPLLENFTLIYEQESTAYPGKMLQIYKLS